MTGVEVIVAALAAGAAAGTSDAVKTAVADAYTGLRDALRRRLAGHGHADQALDAYETDPGFWYARLGADLTETGVDRDEQILAAARQLLALVDPAGTQYRKLTVDMRGAQQPQVGDNTIRIGTNYGPAAGTMTGPVTLTYEAQLPGPPGTAGGVAGSPAPGTEPTDPASVQIGASYGPVGHFHGTVIVDGVVVAPPIAEQTLPADVAGFVGRRDELQRLLAAVADAADVPARAVAIHAVDGMAGVGKTAFAVHAAHRLAERFPDGQLFVALRAHAHGQARVEPAVALEILLQADGVAAQQIPASLDARAGLWRDRLMNKRVLLVLDDAADTAHVAPLLPGAPGCLVLITSRRKLTTLSGATILSLDTLSRDQAAQLFIQRAGPRAHQDPTSVDEITQLCGCLPLAITLTAARLHTHPAWTIADLACDLDQTHDRLSGLASGELAVAAAFDLSYRDLPAGQQRLFRRLGLHPGTDFDAYAAAALDGTDLAAARRGLEDLLEHNLINEPHRGRFRFHDLIAKHAHALATTDATSEPHAALDRLIGFYLHTATAAAKFLARRASSVDAAQTIGVTAEVPTLANREQATAWLASEQANLTAAAGWAVAHRRTWAAIGIPADLHDYLRVHGPWTLALDLHRTALAAAQHANDQLGLAVTLTNLADAQYLTGDDSAAATAGQALDLYRRLGHRRGQANALEILARVQGQAGDYMAAAMTAGQAVDLYRQVGDRLGQGSALEILARVRSLTADYRAAATTAGQALDLYRQLGDLLGQADALQTLGLVQYQCDDNSAAATAGQALDLYRQLGDRLGQANALRTVGLVEYITGEYAAAATTAGEALDLYRELGDQLGQANALEILARVEYLTDDYAAAATIAGQALDLCRQLGYRLGQANAMQTLGVVHYLTGNHAACATTLGQALDIFRELETRDSEAETLNHIGELLLSSSTPAAAHQRFTAALAIAQAIGTSNVEARALEGIGVCALREGHHDKGITHLRTALAIYQRINSPNAIRVESTLRQHGSNLDMDNADEDSATSGQ